MNKIEQMRHNFRYHAKLPDDKKYLFRIEFNYPSIADCPATLDIVASSKRKAKRHLKTYTHFNMKEFEIISITPYNKIKQYAAKEKTSTFKYVLKIFNRTNNKTTS